MAFHETRFPIDLAFGARGGPERRTVVVTAASGAEERNSWWANSRRRYDVGRGLSSLNDLQTVIDFFEERRGRLHGFRFRDPLDWKSCPPKNTPAFTDQAIGTGDGATTTFQLVKKYGSAFAPWSRTISKPVAGSVLIGVGGVAQGSGWSLDTTTGIVTFAAAPASAAAVTAGFEFDVPCRFDRDEISVSIDNFIAGEAPNIPIVEILL